MSNPPSRWVRRALELTGSMSPRSSRYPVLYRLWMGFNLVSCSYCFVGSLGFFFLAEGAATEKLQSVQICLAILCGLLKRCNAVFQQDRVDSLLSRFDGLWDQLYEQPTNRAIMDSSHKRCRLLYKGYNSCLLIIFGLTFCFSMAGDKPPLEIITPFDTERQLVLSQVIIVFAPLSANSCSLFTYLALSEQLATYVKVIRRNLREEKISREIIIVHQDVIELLNRTNGLFSWLLFIEINTVTIECSCSAYLLYKVHIKEGKHETMVIDLIDFSFSYVIPYIICYSGSKIINESELLFQDAYNSMWYEHNIESKKTLRIVMLAASKTLRWHYKNVVDFGMVLFLSIIELTYKLINMILWLDRPEKM